MTDFYHNIHLMQIDGIRGYLWSEIKLKLSPEDYKRFTEWMVGQTMLVMDKDEYLVYEWDFDKFREVILTIPYRMHPVKPANGVKH